MHKVGIPRALLYYQYFPMWKVFFESLGAEVVTTQPTNRATVVAGASRLISDTCLPVKIFAGHVVELGQQNVDFVFIPSIRSIEKKVYNCSKFMGLPDIIRATVQGARVLDVDIDVNQGRRSTYLSVYEVGRNFTKSPLKVKRAWDSALATHQKYVRLMRAGLTPDEAVNAMWGGAEEQAVERMKQTDAAGQSDLTIAVIGHPYNVYDGYVNHDMVGRLRQMGVRVLTGEMATEDELRQAVVDLEGKPYWTYEGDLVGSGGHYLKRPDVDGVLSIVSFACGPDSVMLDSVQRAARSDGRKPYMTITVDEHTGAAGFVTRIEAFIDMIRRRKRALQAAAQNVPALERGAACTMSL